MKRLSVSILGLISVFMSFLPHLVHSQAGTGMKMHPSQADSIKQVDYSYTFPLLGKRVVQKGFAIPYPVGIMINTFAASQLVEISELKVGFNDNAPQDFNFVEFGEVKANLQNINVRADLWLFPFLNIYGLFGPLISQTSVSVVEPVTFTTNTNFNGYTYGIGTTLAAGFHGFWATADVNTTWTSLEQFDTPVNATMMTPRVGMAIPFRKNPSSNFAFWVGCSYVLLNRETSGTIKISDISPNGSSEALQKIIDETEEWYQDLSLPQQRVVKQIAQALKNRLDDLEPVDASISYSLKKEPKSKLSVLIGAQYQHSLRWQFRTEIGFLGGRTSGLLSANYRFRW